MAGTETSAANGLSHGSSLRPSVFGKSEISGIQHINEINQRVPNFRETRASKGRLGPQATRHPALVHLSARLCPIRAFLGIPPYPMHSGPRASYWIIASPIAFCSPGRYERSAASDRKPIVLEYGPVTVVGISCPHPSPNLRTGPAYE